MKVEIEINSATSLSISKTKTDLCHLHLTSLDVSCNRIASLPVELRLMTELVNLELQNNPLTSPPASVSYSHTLYIVHVDRV